MARALALAAAVLALTAPPLAMAKGKPLPAPNQPPSPRLTKAEATRIFLADHKVAAWLSRYPHTRRAVDTTFKKSVWTVSIWWGDAVGAVRGWPAWRLAAAAVFAAGFRIGLNVSSANVIDVGYSGVIGADRIAHGQVPYGNFPVEDGRKACGPADSAGEIRERVQTNGRCESANPQGDTYGPAAFEAYLPGYLILGWTGKWDDLPAAHFSSIMFDLLCALGLALVGLRFGGTRRAVTLGLGWGA